MTDPIRFTVDVPDDHAVVEVVVYDTLDDLNAGYNGPGRVVSWCDAQSTIVIEDGAPKVLPECGRLLFCRERLDPFVIAHECTHMAVNIHQNLLPVTLPDGGGYIEKAITLAVGEDEAFATTVSALVLFVGSGLASRGLLTSA